MHTYVQADPSIPVAGADLSIAPTNSDRFRLLTLRATFAADITVANRYPHFQFVSPSGTIIHEVVAPVVVASAIVTYNLVGGNGAPATPVTVTDGVLSLPLPDIWFPNGTTVKSKTTAIDAGDAWTAIYYSAVIGDEWEHLNWLQQIAGSVGALDVMS